MTLKMRRDAKSGVAAAKDEMRRTIRARLRAMTPEQRAEASLLICHEAARWTAFAQAKCVALFSPLPSEPDVRLLIEEAWAEGKRVALPLMIQQGTVPKLDWHEVRHWEELIIPGPFGLSEPDPINCARIRVEEIDCAFIPGVAFDSAGYRLGRGGGFYDVFLSQVSPTLARVGVMFACQGVPEVPREAHDQALPGVVSEEGMLPHS